MLADLTSRFWIIAGREEIRPASVGKEMREVPKTQGQTCWANDGASTKDKSEGTAKSVPSLL